MAKDPWWNNLPSSGYRVCQTCQHPYPGDGDGCRNPGCWANPSISPERKKSMKAAHKKSEDEKRDRENLARIRSQSFGRRST